jgi:nucleotide-binding universal stress UspA family protein
MQIVNLKSPGRNLMIKSVLVPLDGSELAEQALGYAVPIAVRHNADIHLVFVIGHDASASDDDDARAYLKGIGERLDRTVEVHVRLGIAADEIIDTGDELDEPLIVMTTHGRTGIGRWIYGSVADKVVHASEAPVLLLRSTSGKLESGEIRKILAPVDGSAYSEAALGYAKSMAKIFDSELHIAQVAETASLYRSLGYEMYAPAGAQPMSDVVEHMVNQAHKYVSGVTSELKAEGFSVQGVVLEGFPGEELISYERRIEPQLVVMATRGRSGFDRFIFGSVAERVLKSGTTPVLMVKPSGALDE